VNITDWEDPHVTTPELIPGCGGTGKRSSEPAATMALLRRAGALISERIEAFAAGREIDDQQVTVYIDDAHRVLSDPTHSEEARQALRHIARYGRKAKVGLLVRSETPLSRDLIDEATRAGLAENGWLEGAA
jgi:hypothetical protein